MRTSVPIVFSAGFALELLGRRELRERPHLEIDEALELARQVGDVHACPAVDVRRVLAW